MSEDKKPWQTLGSKIVYQNNWLKVQEDKTKMPGGKEGIYGFIDGGSGSLIIALNDKNEIYLIESFRYPTQKWQWELPEGGLNPNSSFLDSAKGELREELGMTAKKWTDIGEFGPSHNGFMKDIQSVFVAEDLEAVDQQLGDFESIRSIKAFTLDELLEMINEGSFVDGQSLAAITRYIAWTKSKR